MESPSSDQIVQPKSKHLQINNYNTFKTHHWIIECDYPIKLFNIFHKSTMILIHSADDDADKVKNDIEHDDDNDKSVADTQQVLAKFCPSESYQ